jgi:hypothetical protein
MAARRPRLSDEMRMPDCPEGAALKGGHHQVSGRDPLCRDALLTLLLASSTLVR